MSTNVDMISTLREDFAALVEAIVRHRITEMIALPRLARVLSYSPAGEADINGAIRPTCTVQLLLAGGEDDPGVKPISGVEVPTFLGGPTSHCYGRIEAGALIRLGFYHGDVSRPFIDAVLAGPPVNTGRLFELKAGSSSITVESDGTVVITAAAIRIGGDSRRLLTIEGFNAWKSAIFPLAPPGIQGGPVTGIKEIPLPANAAAEKVGVE